MKKYLLISLIFTGLSIAVHSQDYKDDADEAKDSKYQCGVV